MEEELKQIVHFLHPAGRTNVKRVTAITVAQLTGNPDGVTLLKTNLAIQAALLGLVHDQDEGTAKNSFSALTNLSADEAAAVSMASISSIKVVDQMVKCILNPGYPHASSACAVLANLTRVTAIAEKSLTSGEAKMDELISVVCVPNFNTKGEKLDLLSTVITNYSQSAEGRRQLMASNGKLLLKVLPFISFSDSADRRHATVAVLHNCCFEKRYHSQLLSEDIDILSRLLLPLVSGKDSFSDEETDELPDQLQFLPETHTREPNTAVRKLLLESLMQLCVTREGRKVLRAKGTYYVLRELHKAEADLPCILVLEDVVNFMIRTEDEIGFDDISSLNVSPEMAEKFEKLNGEYLAAEASSSNNSGGQQLALEAPPPPQSSS